MFLRFIRPDFHEVARKVVNSHGQSQDIVLDAFQSFLRAAQGRVRGTDNDFRRLTPAATAHAGYRLLIAEFEDKPQAHEIREHRLWYLTGMAVAAAGLITEHEFGLL